MGASLAAMLLVVLTGAIAAAQSAADTAATETWKTAAASAAAPANLVPTPPDMDATQPGAAEIPAATSADASPQAPSIIGPDSQPADSQPPNESNDVARYEAEQSGIPPEQLRNMQQFQDDGELSTPFGMQLREARRTLKSGEEADGLLITVVQKGSAAAAVGLHPYAHGVHDALAGAAMVGAMMPFGQAAILLIPALDYLQVGESYDMIIGVDGSRVTNFLDFQDRMRDLQPGEIVYLSIVRNGKRIQVTMPVTAATVQANTN